MSEQEFREYAAHLAFEPPAGERVEWWLSQILAVLVNTNRAKGKEPVKPADLIPDRWALPESRAEKLKKFKNQLIGLAAFGGKAK
ncbi:phage tail assembly protein T [Limnoglobus roseus]|uniref:Minor tail T domain-containing protein n=1 Tax=Limnoglobus roseus TaxID=2598579 RepID=A0A5C1A8J7_9BACT|nr:hypothetical protein [Limnoglobus roseus]QEL14336.1 hypothetical protein PX52LOC_01224 [Limnoglobus roseus]